MLSTLTHPQNDTMLDIVKDLARDLLAIDCDCCDAVIVIATELTLTSIQARRTDC